MCRNATFVSLHLPIYQFNYSLEIEFNAIVQLTSSTEFVSNSMGIIRLISIDVLFKLNYCCRFGCFNNIKSTCLPFYFDFKPTSWHFKCIYNFFFIPQFSTTDLELVDYSILMGLIRIRLMHHLFGQLLNDWIILLWVFEPNGKSIICFIHHAYLIFCSSRCLETIEIFITID